MMSEHMDIKHKVKKINSKSSFVGMLEDSMLSDNEKDMMRMHYIEHKDFDYIADTLGYTKAGIIKMHARILKKLESLL